MKACPRCADPAGECDPKDFQSMVVCHLGQIAREFKRFNDWMEGSMREEEGDGVVGHNHRYPPSRDDCPRCQAVRVALRPACPYCGNSDHLAGSPASDRCRERIEREAPVGLGTDGQL